MPKKKFIDKKNAVTFYLAHRSQKDPLITDENAPQRVLVPINEVGAQLSVPGSSRGKLEDTKKQDLTQRKEEQKKFGIYFDDDYDYLQHLKDSQEVSNIEWDICERIYATDTQPKPQIQNKTDLKDVKLKLPSSVFPSEYVEEIGLLNKAAPNYGPRPDLDPDVIAALDDDFDFSNPDNALDDNFMELAGGRIEGDHEAASESKDDIEGLFSDDSEDDDSEDGDTIESMDGPNFDDSDEDGRGHGHKSNFTSYSMSSSVVKRNEQLSLLDERFEKMFEEYDGTEIGPLDGDEIEGHLQPQSDILMQYAEEFAANKAKEEMLDEKILKLAVRYAEESSSSESSSEDDAHDDEKKWDCHSILSTYSNSHYRPKLIKEPSKRNPIEISSKTGMPVGILGTGLTAGNLKELNQEYDLEHPQHHDTKSAASMVSSIWLPRPKVESQDERMERKKRIKEYKRERRIERKANSDAFKEEKKRQVKVQLNCKANASAGLKL